MIRHGLRPTMADIPVVIVLSISYNWIINEVHHEKDVYDIIAFMHDHLHRQRVHGRIVQGTGAKRCQESKCNGQMHDRHGPHIEPDMFAAPLCQMHGHRFVQALFRLATMAWPAQPVYTIFRLEICGIGVLSRQGPAINSNPTICGIFLYIHRFFTCASC